VDGRRSHALEEPTSLNTLALLPQLVQMGVRAFKIEGRQRSAAYVGEVTRAWRAALDQACRAVDEDRPFTPDPAWQQALSRHAEGAQTTLGAFERPWRRRPLNADGTPMMNDSAFSAPGTPPAAPRRWGLTVGPVQYLWPRERLLAFYAELADSPADCIVLGEVVCARRRELRLDDWLALGRELAQAGKQVVHATQTLVETEADLRQIERLGAETDQWVEAGDASALALLQGACRWCWGRTSTSTATARCRNMPTWAWCAGCRRWSCRWRRWPASSRPRAR
jgi:collagenase-like PrtC family protease